MEIDILKDSIQSLDLQLLNLLLVDNSTKRNIVWATNDYISLGEYYFPECEITVEQIIGKNGGIIKPRVIKTKNMQSSRTRNNAEVFTPLWICNAQNNLIDDDWLGQPNVFNTAVDKQWKATKGKIEFPTKNKITWQDYVRAKRMEITCGEAPYLVSRYDTVTGEVISDVYERIGMLDRKLRVIDENVDNEADWFLWVKKAYQNVYGYEYMGDSLLIARTNLLYTFIDYMLNKWNRKPTKSELRQIAYIISWNIWQMDGFKYIAPYSGVVHQKKDKQMTLFDMGDDEKNTKTAVYCNIRDWSDKCYVEFRKLFKNQEH